MAFKIPNLSPISKIHRSKSILLFFIIELIENVLEDLAEDKFFWVVTAIKSMGIIFFSNSFEKLSDYQPIRYIFYDTYLGNFLRKFE